MAFEDQDSRWKYDAYILLVMYFCMSAFAFYLVRRSIYTRDLKESNSVLVQRMDSIEKSNYLNIQNDSMDTNSMMQTVNCLLALSSYGSVDDQTGPMSTSRFVVVNRVRKLVPASISHAEIDSLIARVRDKTCMSKLPPLLKKERRADSLFKKALGHAYK